MPFWRPEFLLFLGLCLVLLRLSPAPWRKLLLTLAGLYFYAWWDLRFVPLLAGMGMADWALALGMQRLGYWRKTMFLTGLALHLGLLAFFKYADFFLTAPAGSTLWLIMPLGLSFQTFSAITYLSAVYSGRMQARKNLVDVVCFATFFPVISAGPIVSADKLMPQLDTLPKPAIDDLYEGLLRFSIGLFKKLVLADHLGLYVAEVYGNVGAYDASSTWAAVLAYALQIYLDFSAYSDMAIGVARAMGVRLPENFNFPYAAKNPSEFWRRWHMSLSFWFRDYVYIPLGGSRLSTERTCANLMLVMLICGIWHGSGWTFALWGALHGLGLCAHRLWRLWQGQCEHSPFLGSIAWAGSTLFTGLCWIPFRAEDLGHTRRIISALMSGGVVHWIHPFIWVVLGVTVLAHALRVRDHENLLLRSPHWFVPAGILTLIWLSLIFATEGFSPFLYARF
ncbi:MAG: MBOAT family O-acyltransferase [Pseudomonadota bacterium]